MLICLGDLRTAFVKVLSNSLLSQSHDWQLKTAENAIRKCLPNERAPFGVTRKTLW
jgi:hypothetical protein